ncbi:MAG: hypothetical protein OFPI_20210 [Osedax symbiont Rs2]|nr:MAG: hypothetical protein OFPI_20210 [Osedax symbiont Rs2]
MSGINKLRLDTPKLLEVIGKASDWLTAILFAITTIYTGLVLLRGY